MITLQRVAVLWNGIHMLTRYLETALSNLYKSEMNITMPISFVKLISVSDVVFFIVALVTLLLLGSVLTIKNNISFALGKSFTIVGIYVLLLFVALYMNLINSRLLNLDETFFSTIFVYDFISNNFIPLLIIFSLVFLIVLYSYISNGRITVTFEYPLVVLFCILSMLLIIISHDLFFWFLSLELQSFCLYALAAYRTNRSFLQTEAGLKYFIFGSLASSLYLFGLSLIYWATGTLNLDSLSAILMFSVNDSIATIINIALLLIFIGLFFKLAVAPFHVWLPGVYTYTSSIAVFMFILLPKISLLYMLLQFSKFQFASLFYIVIVISLIIGTLYAFYSTRFKTFLGYSAIANNAFFLAPMVFPSFYSALSLIFFTYSYNILLTIIFIPCLFAIRYDNSMGLENLRDFIAFKKANIVYAVLFIIAFFSLAGIPPFIGFFAKLFILMSALAGESYILIVALLTASLIAALYYIRFAKMIFFGSSLIYSSFITIPLAPTILAVTLSYINVFFITAPTQLLCASFI
jgi:NADH-quinone oxidoreductase subunit N